MIRSVGKRILLFVFSVLLVTLAIDNILAIREMRSDYRDSLVMRCRYLATDLKNGIEKVLALGIRINEIEGIDTRCRQIVASDPEIVYAMVENAHGGILYASEPDLAINGSGRFLSETRESAMVVLDDPRYGTVYDISLPIFAPDGAVAGRVRLGFPESILNGMTMNMVRHTSIVLTVASILVFFVLLVFIRRDLTRPVQTLCDVADRIADGDFGVGVPKMATREFEQLGAALREMADSLRDRERRVQESYAELELANRELQSSYEQQERISVELATSREMFRNLLEHASDAILVVDDEDRVVLVNRAAETFFGIERQVVENQHYASFMHRLYDVNSGPGDVAMLQQLRRDGAAEWEIAIIHPESGMRVVGSVRGAAVTGPDGQSMAQLTIRDVTREKEIKENLERLTIDLQNLNTMKNSFLGMASHELKTPLTVISGYAELILSGVSNETDEATLSMVRYINDAADRLSAIVRDMVDVTLMDRRRLPLRIRLTDFNELVRTSTREMEYFFRVRNQFLCFDLGTEIPQIFCDPDRAFQIIANLVGNAVKFTPDGGTVTVSTRLVRIMRAPHKAASHDDVEALDSRFHTYVELCVRDTGIGIDFDEQTQIFEKFYEIGKIEEHFTGKVAFRSRGTGLGLAIVKGIVDRHGGAIWVESAGYDPDDCPGSAFFVLLPLLPGVEPGE